MTILRTRPGVRRRRRLRRLRLRPRRVEFIKLLGARVRAGLRVRGVPTSQTPRSWPKSLGIPLVSLEEAMPLALTVDGADEVDPHLNLIKGYGRALVREKIVAAASRRLVILVGPGKTDAGSRHARQPARRGRAVRAAALPHLAGDLGRGPSCTKWTASRSYRTMAISSSTAGPDRSSAPAELDAPHPCHPRSRRYGIVHRHGGRGAGRRRPLSTA